MSSKPRLVDQRTLAADVDLSTRRIRELVEDGLPRVRTPEGWRYPIVATRQWLAARRKAEAAKRAGRSVPSTALERARLVKSAALTLATERKLAALEGATIPRVTADAFGQERLRIVTSALRHAMLNYVDQLVGLGSPAEVSRVLVAAIDAAFAAARDSSPEPPPSVTEPKPRAPQTLTEARIRRWTAEARIIELHALVETGVWVNVEEWAQHFFERYTRMRAVLLAAPGKYALQAVALDTVRARALLEEIVEEAIAAAVGHA